MQRFTTFRCRCHSPGSVEREKRLKIKSHQSLDVVLFPLSISDITVTVTVQKA